MRAPRRELLGLWRPEVLFSVVVVIPVMIVVIMITVIAVTLVMLLVIIFAVNIHLEPHAVSVIMPAARGIKG
jgi:hypothetical protein